MASEKTGKSAKQATPDREDRLKAALKANMAKRKAQARARQSQDAKGDSAQEKNKSEE
ncbi:MAG: hypothetical protein AAFY35_01375 [Pseudomonadota bacterium]